MKNVYPSLLVLLTSFCMLQKAEAKIWRVNLLSNYNGTTQWGDNFGGTQAYPVFKQLQQPNDSAFVAAGDTIHLEGAVDEYDGITITKKLIIIGPGYLLTDNPNTSTNMLEAKISQFRFSSRSFGVGSPLNTNSSGSQLIGVHVTNNNGVSIDEQSNITIKRCKIDAGVGVGANNSDIFIVQNFFDTPAGSNAEAIIESTAGFPANLIFNNNICRKTLTVDYSVSYVFQECNNNVFEYTASPSINVRAAKFQNNILATPASTAIVNGGVAGANVSNNISTNASGQLGTANNNKVVTDVSGIFLTSTSPDGKYQLKAGSPALAAGTNGIDIGAYGSAAASNKYTLSGLPPIPVIYDISTAGVADASGLPVTIKARTIK